MPRCDACEADIDVGARFCGECGAVVRAKTREFGPGGKNKGGGNKPSKVREATRETRKGAGPAAAPAAAALDPIKTTLKGVPVEAITPPPKSSEAGESRSGTASSRTEFQRLLEEVETGFDAILVEPDSVAPPKPDAGDEGGELPTAENNFDQAQAEKLFHELVVANAQPIRDFMIEIRLGEPNADWITYCEPAVRAILRSAEGMGHAELVERLRVYLGTLSNAKEAQPRAGGAAAAEADRAIRGEPREKIIDAYSELIVFFPEAFALEAESNAREAAIVAALLAKISGLQKVGLDRILSTGIASLGLFYISRPKDIVELTGVDGEVAEEVARTFQEYRRIASQISPVGGRAEERRLLRSAANAVLAATQAYDAASPSSPDRRRHRRARSLSLADMSLFLARLGELERMKRIQALPFSMRCADVVAFLDEVEKKERRQE